MANTSSRTATTLASDRSLLIRLRVLFEALSFRRRQTIETLPDLNDHLLRDIGLTPGTLMEIKFTGSARTRGASSGRKK
jgi:uncharacterized protein YjiS (DUF1127 family)